ncbi:hypothetical protein C8R46DRAFT_1041682 [Mycena filopes]|nr:hypothetical protein C8R46DRAFT_1041682 [Mycena filopes]
MTLCQYETATATAAGGPVDSASGANDDDGLSYKDRHYRPEGSADLASGAPAASAPGNGNISDHNAHRPPPKSPSPPLRGGRGRGRGRGDDSRLGNGRRSSPPNNPNNIRSASASISSYPEPLADFNSKRPPGWNDRESDRERKTEVTRSVSVIGDLSRAQDRMAQDARWTTTLGSAVDILHVLKSVNDGMSENGTANPAISVSATYLAETNAVLGIAILGLGSANATAKSRPTKWIESTILRTNRRKQDGAYGREAPPRNSNSNLTQSQSHPREREPPGHREPSMQQREPPPMHRERDRDPQPPMHRDSHRDPQPQRSAHPTLSAPRHTRRSPSRSESPPSGQRKREKTRFAPAAEIGGSGSASGGTQPEKNLAAHGLVLRAEVDEFVPDELLEDAKGAVKAEPEKIQAKDVKDAKETDDGFPCAPSAPKSNLPRGSIQQAAADHARFGTVSASGQRGTARSDPEILFLLLLGGMRRLVPRYAQDQAIVAKLDTDVASVEQPSSSSAVTPAAGYGPSSQAAAGPAAPIRAGSGIVGGRWECTSRSEGDERDDSRRRDRLVMVLRAEQLEAGSRAVTGAAVDVIERPFFGSGDVFMDPTVYLLGPGSHRSRHQAKGGIPLVHLLLDLVPTKGFLIVGTAEEGEVADGDEGEDKLTLVRDTYRPDNGPNNDPGRFSPPPDRNVSPSYARSKDHHSDTSSRFVPDPPPHKRYPDTAPPSLSRQPSQTTPVSSGWEYNEERHSRRSEDGPSAVAKSDDRGPLPSYHR